jgi:5-methylcytosine-specific restriction enzyme A
VTLRCCVECGTPSPGPRCSEHTLDTKPTAHARGYDAAWQRLSKRARRLQPFCTDCGSTEDLQCDHTPEAWARKSAGKTLRLADIAVVCGDRNRSRGAARGAIVTRGNDPSAVKPDPAGRQNLSYTPAERLSDEFDRVPRHRRVVDRADAGSFPAVEDLERRTGEVERHRVLVFPGVAVGECDSKARFRHPGSLA